MNLLLKEVGEKWDGKFAEISIRPLPANEHALLSELIERPALRYYRGAIMPEKLYREVTATARVRKLAKRLRGRRSSRGTS